MVSSTKKWLFIKVSSVILIPLMIWFTFILAGIYDKTFAEVVEFFTSQPTKILISLLFVVSYFFSALTISEIFEDYMGNQKIKNVANKILYLFAIIIPLLTLIIIYNLIKDILEETFIKIKNREISQLLAINSRVKPPFSDYGDNFSELYELIINNIVVIIGWIFMCKWLGVVFFLSFYSIVLTLSAAILICVFFVQHNYENTYARNTKNWDLIDGAILGSSNLDIPNWLNWFLADISFHSIHHLSERIPNYNLRACHKANIHLLQKSKFLKLKDFYNCFKYIIWDNKNEKLIPIS